MNDAQRRTLEQIAAGVASNGQGLVLGIAYDGTTLNALERRGLIVRDRTQSAYGYVRLTESGQALLQSARGEKR
jgi:hypothetical protein